MNKISFRYLWLLTLCLLACSPITILDTESEDDFHLANYKTFDFYEVETSGDAIGPEYKEQLDYLKQEIEAQLKTRGLTRSSANPDLKVNMGIVLAEKVQTRETDIRTDGPRYMGQRRYTWKSQEVEVGRYKEGTLSVHLVDNSNNEMVWQGAAESIVPEDPGKQQRRIAEGVQKLIASIPQ
ncbi:DUF4136 domain-containing protein [Pontibacter ruber]|uniref:DUF4136 domain-containing protein n=1 Tax=Pontibacter ruber TaxID=1343895 RepID=A0ABW5CUB6_9BACT|nr:DUF4136 domain-containing protein [Pontibacter ruber]